MPEMCPKEAKKVFLSKAFFGNCVKMVTILHRSVGPNDYSIT